MSYVNSFAMKRLNQANAENTQPQSSNTKIKRVKTNDENVSPLLNAKQTPDKQANKRKLNDTFTLTERNLNAESKREPLKPLNNEINKTNTFEPYKFVITKHFIESAIEQNNVKKTDNSVTLMMSCTSDPIHDIVLNNFRSSTAILPPFKMNCNLECNSDDPPLLSDKLEDLFSFKRVNERADNTNLDDLDQTAELLDQTTIASEHITEEKTAHKRKLSESSTHLTNNSSFNDPIKKVKTESDEAPQIQFTMNMAKRIFSVEEIRNCIFPDKNNTIRSKRIAFDRQKIEEIQKSIAKEFSLNDYQLENLWQSIRSRINTKIKNLRRTKTYSLKQEDETK